MHFFLISYKKIIQNITKIKLIQNLVIIIYFLKNYKKYINTQPKIKLF